MATGLAGVLQGLTGAPGLGPIAAQSMSGWQGVAAMNFVTKDMTKQKLEMAKTEQDAMQKQAIIKMVTDMIEGACKMIKASGEAIKGLC